MHSVTSLCRTDAAPPGTLSHGPHNRQAAALYLQAATLSDDEVKRALLRQCAAELILPRFLDRGNN
jgi:hypothetical protein